VVRNGPPAEVVEVLDVDLPEVEPGTVRVAVSAASINFGDIARCKGGVAAVMMQPPFTLGMDMCGVVEAEGEGVSGWLGKRVVATAKMSFGGMAEAAIAPVTGVFDAPPELDDIEAAAFLLPFHTAHLSLHERGQLAAGETVLVIGAATSVGTAVIQLAVAAGARVIAVAGGPEKGALCRELGAELAIDRTTEDLFDAVMEHTGGRGVDIVCDMIGGEGTEGVWPTIVNGGRYVAVGFNDDTESGLTGRPLRKVSTGNFSVVGVMMGYNEASLPMRRFGVNPFPPEVGQQVHAKLRELVASGKIRPTIGRRITMDQVAETLRDHSERRTAGRSVVDVAGSVA
jgi:NADPH:quinone reductase